MSNLIVENLIESLSRRFGKARQHGKARILTFGKAFTCSINYSKLLGGHKYFYAVPEMMLDPAATFPATKSGEFVLFICATADKVLVLPKSVVVSMMKDVESRRIDVFVDSGTYILQTTKHPKLDVTGFLNAFPSVRTVEAAPADANEKSERPDRIHVRVQWSLIRLGQIEGCTVWIPINDRNLTYRGNAFSKVTVERLPNFGFDQNTQRIVQNIDVLWLTKNVIRKAFEIESTTSIYSGLLRLNDLVLSQPNNQIDLFIAANQNKRERVHAQLTRPTFQPLLSACQFISFEAIDVQLERLDALSLDQNARVSGVLRGEHFTLPDHFVYPTNLS